MRRDAKFMEDRAFKKSREMPAEGQSLDVPLVQEKQGQQGGQTLESSTVTSTNISSEGGNTNSSQ